METGQVARFEKVSYEQFRTDMGVDDTSELGNLFEYTRDKIYARVRLPTRATRGSAGYDFYAPFAFQLYPGESIRIPTGVRAWIAPGWFLACMPRSSLGFKYRTQLDNTVGIIDGDYYNAENEGHIILQLTNDSRQGKVLDILPGTAIAQGILLPYGLAEGDCASEIRTGGFGSTGR